MKNLRFILSLLPVLVLSCFVYFSSIGFYSVSKGNNPGKESIKDMKPSGGGTLYITLTGSSSCLTGDYSYCINGGTSYSFNNEEIAIGVPCDEEFTICVRSSGNCTGSWTGSVICDGGNIAGITLTSSGAKCTCSD